MGVGKKDNPKRLKFSIDLVVPVIGLGLIAFRGTVRYLALDSIANAMWPGLFEATHNS